MKLTQAKNAVESKPKDLKKEKKRNVSRRFVRRKQKKNLSFFTKLTQEIRIETERTLQKTSKKRQLRFVKKNEVSKLRNLPSIQYQRSRKVPTKIQKNFPRSKLEVEGPTKKKENQSNAEVSRSTYKKERKFPKSEVEAKNLQKRKKSKSEVETKYLQKKKKSKLQSRSEEPTKRNSKFQSPSRPNVLDQNRTSQSNGFPPG